MQNSKINLCLALALILVNGLAQAADKPPTQVIFEAGMAAPYGNLGADFDNTRLGLGATNGLELGFGYRIPLSETLTVSPNFHFVDYGNFEGFEELVDEFTIESSSYRFDLEMLVMMPGAFKTPRPFFGLGVGWYRNRVTGYIEDFIEPVNKSINSIGYSMRAGIRIIGLELSVSYHVNRFNSWHIEQSEYRERYNWDNISFRGGWLIPLGG